MAEDVVQFMDAQGIAKASFLGHSMGGKTVLTLSQLHPGRMERMVVADIAARAYTPHTGPSLTPSGHPARRSLLA